jgi:translation initiation factor 5B
MSAIKTQTKSMNEKLKLIYKIPGLLIIDTPGHESFTNLRTRGSSICDIAILVVDILHGLENQTIDSIGLLKKRKTPFIVALNKVDTCTEWKKNSNSPIQETLKKQQKTTINHFHERVKLTIGYFAEQGLNACLYYENKDFLNYVSLVPTSAHTGEGIPDLLMLMTQLTQRHLGKKILFNEGLQCTILEVKVIDGHGTTIDVILSQGIIKSTDIIVICGLNGPIVTSIRALLTPKPMKEMRVKGEFIHHKEIRAAQGKPTK